MFAKHLPGNLEASLPASAHPALFYYSDANLQRLGASFLCGAEMPVHQFSVYTCVGHDVVSTANR